MVEDMLVLVMCFFNIVDGFVAAGCVSPSWLDGQLVNELARCFVGVLRPPFLPLCIWMLSGS